MLLEIPGLLNQVQLDKIHEVLDKAEFQDGKLTAGWYASRVKNNQEMRQDPQQKRSALASHSRPGDRLAGHSPVHIIDRLAQESKTAERPESVRRARPCPGTHSMLCFAQGEAL